MRLRLFDTTVRPFVDSSRGLSNLSKTKLIEAITILTNGISILNVIIIPAASIIIIIILIFIKLKIMAFTELGKGHKSQHHPR